MITLGTKLLQRVLCIATVISAVFRPVAASPLPPPFTLSVHVEWESADKLVHRTIRPRHDALHPFDHFRIHAVSDRPVYMYVVEVDSSTGASLLYPQDRHTRVPNDLLLPARGKYRVQGPSGEYTLAVFASQQPITQVQCEKLSLRCPLFPEPIISNSLTRGLPAEPGQSTDRANDTSESDSAAKSDEKKSTQKERADSSSRKESAEPAPASGQSAKDGTRGGAQHVDSRTGVATIQSDSSGSAYISLTFQRVN